MYKYLASLLNIHTVHTFNKYAKQVAAEQMRFVYRSLERGAHIHLALNPWL